MIPLLVIVGTTATGKSSLAVRLAERFDGEVVNADSRQVYRSMDIGTGKPSAWDRGQVPHHLLDVIDPDGEFSVALYLQLAGEAIRSIDLRRRLPILVGGTGQYIWALLEGLRIPGIPPDTWLRQSLQDVAAQPDGRGRLLAQLQALDPASASRIDPRNTRRMVRAIEVSILAGRPFSLVRTRVPTPYQPFIIGLTVARPILYRLIDERVESMVRRGWVGEVKGLLDRGYSTGLPSFSSLGYREMAGHVLGETDLTAAVERIKTRTHGFARHQYSWFKPSDPRIQWLDITEDYLIRSAEAIQQWRSVVLPTSPPPAGEGLEYPNP